MGVFDRIVRIWIIRKSSRQLSFDLGVSIRGGAVTPQIVTTQQGISPIGVTRLSHVDISRSRRMVVEPLGELFRRKSKTGRTTIADGSAQLKPGGLDFRLGLRGEVCDGDLDVDDVLGGQARYGR